MGENIPVVLFAYAPPTHVARVLTWLGENAVPLVYAFADGVKTAVDAAAAVTKLLAPCCQSAVVLSDNGTYPDLLFRRR